MSRAYEAMMLTAVRFMHDTDDAKDVVQNVCIKLWEHPDGLEQAADRMAYCIRAVHNASISQLRNRHLSESLDAADQIAATQTDAFADDTLNALLNHLPPIQREVFLMRQYAQMEYSDIAAGMGLSADNVRQLLSRARKRLREIYEKEY